jgi:predicted nucleic-acid-binding protein
VIAVTADVLLAYIVDHDCERSRKAAAFIEGAADAGEQLYVTLGALSQIASELHQVHELDWLQVSDVIHKILSTLQFHIENRDLACAAIIAWMGRGEYGDYILHHRAFEAGCRNVVSLDERLKDLCEIL